jgi:hypothetical protein
LRFEKQPPRVLAETDFNFIFLIEGDLNASDIGEITLGGYFYSPRVISLTIYAALSEQDISAID